ncbi:putative phenazine biosynthesis-like protein [Actinoplanes missouriensis 431]|uniref:Putative phenazine biosynthesis-like protein n=1 Tax=Actinoplanes missouriensis (strain ATCC 14538 / DSM 43046 / CBS 188.64 / JCM 3121 / NBRC 102363 / NCIMB 12654 / NRRL B-3342 / UNCC 431) TaxID=512565 RepID=I0HHC1_ACTM4|nr:PhzF family phenazine biosynthesis protein [Actinoplanes missouriensis]BAL92408.1 putative phenazine biosynthesis-like protein [Actinoplanes missouriensis 431]
MRIRVVDAFTEKPFQGAPAGVLLLDEFPPDAWMQQVAAEVNHAETAFLHPLPAGGEAGWALRWFTPAVEVDLCGHATLASAHVLATLTPTPELDPARPVRFATRSGVLTASVAADGLITLSFPTAPLTPVDADPELGAALGPGVPIVAVHHTGPNTDDLLVEVADEKAVRAVSPDLRTLAALSRRGVIVTAAAEDPGTGYDFVSRFFGPAVGVDEDPVTGSAHTALAPYWAGKLGRDELVGYQASARGGFVRVRRRGERTELSGHAVTVIDGTLHA